MTRRLAWGALLGLVCGACAHVPPTRPLRVYDVPLHDALNVAQLLVLQREGILLHQSHQQDVRISDVMENDFRWVVTGTALGPQRCTVGIYQVRLYSAPDSVGSHDADHREGSESPVVPRVDDTTWVPDAASLDVFRYFPLEPELAERLDALGARQRSELREAVGPELQVEVHSENPVAASPPDDAGVGTGAAGAEAGAPAAPEAEPPAPADPLAGLAEPAEVHAPVRVETSAPDCGLAAEELDGFIAPGNLLLVGDRLGTREVPQAFAALVCWALVKKVGVLAALDLPRAEQARVGAFLQSDGSAAARARLLEGAFWHWPYPDGSSSLAMVELLERLRQWQRAGAPVRVLLVGPGALLGNPREAAISSLLASARRLHPQLFTLLLAGNAHVTRRAGTPWNPGLLPAGYRLAEPDARHVLSLDVTFVHGDGWNCRLLDGAKLKCGVFHLRGPQLHQALGQHVVGVWRAIRYERTNEFGFDGLLDLGHLSPSPPATDPGAVKEPDTKRE